MNQGTSKLLREYSSRCGLSYRQLKKDWNALDRHKRAALRVDIAKEIAFSTSVQRWRSGKRLEQKEAANLLNVPFETFRNWEYGRTIPPHIVRSEIERRMLAA